MTRAARRGWAWVHAVGTDKAIEALRDQGTGEPRPHYAVTSWHGDTRSTFGGAPGRPGLGTTERVGLAELTSRLDAYAREVHPKGTGWILVHGASRWGGSKDAEATAIDWLWVDCDAAGDWDGLLGTLAALGIQALVQRSGGHTPDRPKWHASIPLAAPLMPPEPPAGADPLAPQGSPQLAAWTAHEREVGRWKARYRDEAGWLFGVLAALAGLPFDGFDPAPANRLFQPCYPAARRSPDREPFPARLFDGPRALDWTAALAATGYQPPAPRPARARVPQGTEELDTQEAEDSAAWVAALRAAGLYDRPLAGGRHAIACPWESEHSAPRRPGDTSTVLLATGRFHCSHAHCLGRRNADVLAVLPPAAAALVVAAEDTAGSRRLAAQLAAQVPGPDAVRTTLDGVGAEVARVLGARQPGEVVAIVVPPGAGKSRGVNRWLPTLATGGVHVAPSHELAAQHAADLRAQGGLVQHRAGVLAQRDADGRTLCTRSEAAKAVQDAGGSVPQLVCTRCPDRGGCKALAATQRGRSADLIVTVPQLAASARKALAGRGAGTEPAAVQVVFDEGVPLFEVVSLAPAELAATEAALAEDFARPVWAREWDHRSIAPVRAMLGVLCRTRAGELAADVAADAWERERGRPWLAPARGQPARAEVAGVLGRIVGGWAACPPDIDAGLRCAERIKRSVPQAIKKLIPQNGPAGPRPAAPTGPRPLAERGTGELGTLLATLRVVRAVGDLLWGLDRQGLGAVEWVGGRLRVRTLTAAARDLQAHGGVITDATPALHELRHLRPDARVVRLEVPDGAPVRREVVYRARSARRQLCPGGVPDWERLVPILRDALHRAERAGVRRLLLVTYKPVAEALRDGNCPGADVLGQWGGDWAVAHYGAVRGLNQWSAWDGCATVGDPWPELAGATSDALACAADPEAVLRDLAAGELAQAHGRLRDPSRQAPAWHWHHGSVAPLGWHSDNTHIVRVANGRPAAQRAAVGVSIAALVVAVGGQRVAASATQCSRVAVQRYMAGERVPPPEWVERLRGVAAARGGTGGVAPKPSSRDIPLKRVSGPPPTPTPLSAAQESQPLDLPIPTQQTGNTQVIGESGTQGINSPSPLERVLRSARQQFGPVRAPPPLVRPEERAARMREVHARSRATNQPCPCADCLRRVAAS